MSTPDRRDDIDAIKSLKYRYLRCVDLRLWDELAQTLAPDDHPVLQVPAAGGGVAVDLDLGVVGLVLGDDVVRHLPL